jgi:DNA polymerase
MTDYSELVQQISTCEKCSLSQGRNNTVPGDGSLDADIMFIGEGPGFHEDRQGLPFVGPAGNLLNEMLSSIGLARRDVYITNMVKCRPPNNRDPFPAEIRSCSPYLDAQIGLIQPKVIVTLGRYSFAKFFPNESISRARGRPRNWQGLVIYPMYHPAAALHNPGLRPAIQRDFSALPELIREVAERQAKGEMPEAEQESVQQLSMFE